MILGQLVTGESWLRGVFLEGGEKDDEWENSRLSLWNLETCWTICWCLDLGKGFKFEPLGIFLVVKGLKFHKRGGLHMLILYVQRCLIHEGTRVFCWMFISVNLDHFRWETKKAKHKKKVPAALCHESWLCHYVFYKSISSTVKLYIWDRIHFTFSLDLTGINDVFPRHTASCDLSR